MGTITVEGLGKAYKHYPSRRARLAEWLIPLAGKRHDLRWVLRDVSFRVDAGRALGIIGVNGAGKSTLLKMITGTTNPTTGSVRMTGRVAALLELGLGFHPDFTGRQNAIMASQLLGLSAQDIERLMPGIEAFAEIGEYIDEPLRVYSSGMQMRLAFSVATAVRPDVLIVDEALSVGDTYFQHKSMDRIRSFREQGTTLLLVSHDKGAIQSICDEAILLNEGRLAMQGEPEAVMDYYNALIAEKEKRTVRQHTAQDGRIQTISGTGEATLGHVRLLDEHGEPAETLRVGARVTLEVQVQVNTPIDSLVVGYMIKDRFGQPVFGTNTHHLERSAGPLHAGDRVTLRFGFVANLGEGSYSMAVAAHDAETHMTKNYEWRDLAVVFKVLNFSVPRFVGTSYLPTIVSVEINEHEEALRE
ncbi:ABC transporter ATP-binding protein [Ramlibacter solisilvae]|uniref:Sugar ABC transporter ATP-binding protein n=1 Tax=Ramlibacter tataouinensis TaxID=94132 RepID=A0A127JVB7_9BURK|nr:ABC transporter ATP-binding protein [Ramlibacter tataouinensis]AMO23854.1 sugar ABC transporter ATP-binding protein [Ramlibacter tataouinensis]